MSEPAATSLAGPNTEKAEVPVSAELLVRTFGEMRDELLSSLGFILGNLEDAQDIAQEVFLRCWRTQDRLTDVQNLKAWIFRVALNAARDHQRSAWSRRVKTMQGPELLSRIDDSSPDAVLEEKETLQRLRDALGRLRPDEKEVFLLRQNADLTYEEIAELRGRPVGTIKTQMRSAIQKLRTILGNTTPQEHGG